MNIQYLSMHYTGPFILSMIKITLIDLVNSAMHFVINSSAQYIVNFPFHILLSILSLKGTY